jgi:Xaa-Pro aminopeptidase
MPQNSIPRLIFASSERSPEMLYATRYFVPDPFLFLQQNGKKTILLSDLEIDRGRKEAKVDEVVSLSEVEGPLERKLKGKPLIEQTIASFLRQRRIRRALVPYDFPMGLAVELAKGGVNLMPVSGLFWPEREFKSAEELKSIDRDNDPSQWRPSIKYDRRRRRTGL